MILRPRGRNPFQQLTPSNAKSVILSPSWWPGVSGGRRLAATRRRTTTHPLEWDTTLKQFMRLPLSAVGRVLVNTGRLLAATWRQHPRIVIAETLLSLLSAGIPFVQSGIFALLINELVRTAGQGRTGSVSLLATLAVGTTVLPDALYAWKSFPRSQNAPS